MVIVGVLWGTVPTDDHRGADVGEVEEGTLIVLRGCVQEQLHGAFEVQLGCEVGGARG